MTDFTLSPPLAEPDRNVISPRREIWLAMRGNKGAMAGLIVIITLVLAAILANVIAPNNPLLTDTTHLLAPPVWQDGGSWTYPLGTDAVGRCLLSRLIFGTRLSLFIGCLVVTLSLSIGVSLGLVSGFFRGWLDTAVMRLMDIVLALPSLLLAIVIVVILGPGLINAMIAVAVANVPHYARLTRAAVLTELSKDYVTASRVSGAGTLRLMLATVLPNCAAPLIVQSTLGISSAILDAAALGFLGLGAQAPTPEWGTMLADSREFMERAPWVVTIPGVAILVTVLAFNLMGDGLRDALDPKLKR